MACIIRTKTKPNTKPADIFLNNKETKVLDDFIVDTNEERTRIVLRNKEYSQIEVRKNDQFENFFESKIVLNKELNLVIIHFEKKQTLFQIWHAPDQTGLNFLIQYIDSGPGKIVK